MGSWKKCPVCHGTGEASEMVCTLADHLHRFEPHLMRKTDKGMEQFAQCRCGQWAHLERDEYGVGSWVLDDEPIVPPKQKSRAMPKCVRDLLELAESGITDGNTFDRTAEAVREYYGERKP